MLKIYLARYTLNVLGFVMIFFFQKGIENKMSSSKYVCE